MLRINKRAVNIGPKSFEPELDREREAVVTCKVRERIMDRW